MKLEIDRAVVAQVALMGRELEWAEGELRALIDRLNRDAQSELVAIMWVGRGAFDADDWVEAVETAMVEATTPCADYLLGTPHFADHLEAGMEALGLPLAEEEEALLR